MGERGRGKRWRCCVAGGGGTPKEEERGGRTGGVEEEDERSYFPGEIKVNRVLYLLVFHLFHCLTIVQLSRKLLYLNLLLGIIWNFSDVSVLMRRGI